MENNPLKKNIFVGLVISLVGVLLVFVPSIVGMDGFEGGFALSFLGFFISLIGVVIIAFYRGLAGILDRILKGQGLLVHWTYTPQLWQRYTEKEYADEKAEKKGLFIVLSVISVGTGLTFWFTAPDGYYIMLAMLGLIGLCAFAWQFSAWYYFEQNKSGTREAYVANDGVYMNRRLYAWRFFSGRLLHVKIQEGSSLTTLVFNYSVPSLYGRQTYVARVPVPEGQEETASNIVEKLSLLQ